MSKETPDPNPAVMGNPDNPEDWRESQMKGIELNGRDCGNEFFDPEDAKREHPDITKPL